MVKLSYIGIIRNDPKPTLELCRQADVSSYSRFTRGSMKEFFTFTAKLTAEKERKAQNLDRDAIQENDTIVHRYFRSEGVCAIVITDKEYEPRVAQWLCGKVVDEFLTKYPRRSFINWAPPSNPSNEDDGFLPFPELKEYIVKYQNPENEDSIMKIQNELDQTKVVLHKTIESVLERGEKIDSLVAKSDGLSAQSKMFYTQAKKQNSCCVVM